jgi:hypothetical protein
MVAHYRHAILHNSPVVGHLRYLLEAVGPELRQSIVTSNDEERPFSRDQRRWVRASPAPATRRAHMDMRSAGAGTGEAG